jgi:hypothetical protein
MLRLARDRFAARAQAPSSERFAQGPVFDPGLDRVELAGVGDQSARADARQIVRDRPAVEIGEPLGDDAPHFCVRLDRFQRQNPPGDDLQVPHRFAPEALRLGEIASVAPAVIASEAKQSRDHGAPPVALWIATSRFALLAMTAWRRRLAHPSSRGAQRRGDPESYPRHCL